MCCVGNGPGCFATIQAAVYGWSLGGEFATPNTPRWTYRNEPYLYKIQLATHLDPPAGTSIEEIQESDEKLLVEFLREFLPVLSPNLLKTKS